MAHSCGKLHTSTFWQTGNCVDGDPACEIGDWFDEECNSPGSLLVPVNKQSTGAADD